MTENKVKRSELRHFLNTGTISVPIWSLINKGVPSAEIAMNPKKTTETYIGDDNASVVLEGYAPEISMDAILIKGNAASDYIEALRVARSVLENAETELVNVYQYETPELTYYPAEKQDVSIPINSIGGTGGESTRLGFSLDYIGDPMLGGFSPTAFAFVPYPINTILTTLVIGSVTLAPLFSANHAWLWFAGSVINAVTEVSMTSTLSGATITQYNDAVEVSQGANAALEVGVNHLTVEVVVGTETTMYHIDITRAAA
jgi:hypothetical protein